MNLPGLRLRGLGLGGVRMLNAPPESAEGGALLIEDGSDRILLEGDATDGNDILLLEGTL